VPAASAPFGAGARVVSLTVTWPGSLPLAAAVMVASPQITSTLFFFNSMPTPPLSRVETPRERLTMAAVSKPTFSADRP
jgi:hypothetical protein